MEAKKIHEYISEYEISFTEYKDIFKSKVIKDPNYVSGNFKDTIWRFRSHTSRVNVSINFNIDNPIYGIFSDLIKCWIIEYYEKGFSIQHLASYTLAITDFLKSTNYLDKDKIDVYEKLYLNSKEESKGTIYSRIYKIISFFEFIDFELEEPFAELLNRYNKPIKFPDARVIPKTKDILMFSLVIEDFFKNGLSDYTRISFFPIYFWWNLTTIIPLRINEFCNIKINALIKNENKYKLIIPRSKNFNKRIHRFEEIIIPEYLGTIVEQYLNKTNADLNRELLISSYYSHKNYCNSGELDLTISRSEFASFNFRMILNRFYKEVVDLKYEIVNMEDYRQDISKYNFRKIQRKLRPNDTRHLAFMNLMLQGYHPSEIARLGGHTSVTAQYSYQRHLEHWVDSDLLELLASQSKEVSNFTNTFFSNLIFKSKIANDVILEDEITKIPLKIGYCIDPEMNCMVDNHFECPSWRITYDDYLHYYKDIIEFSESKKIHIKDLLNKLLELHQSSLLTKDSIPNSNTDSNIKHQLVKTSQRIKFSLHQLWVLKERVNRFEQTRKKKDSL